jgi:chitodextrinase
VGTYSTTVNTSDQAVPVHAASTVATYTVLDTIRPGAPVNLTAVANNKAKQIQLSWGASSDNVGVLAYLVSRNGSIVGKSATTSWTDPVWTPGATYTYFVVADDAAGNLSAPSNGATVTISGGGGKKR